MEEQTALEKTINDGGEWVEESRGFVRYMTALGAVDDGYTEWYCLECGAMTEEYDAPCIHCLDDGDDA